MSNLWLAEGNVGKAQLTLVRLSSNMNLSRVLIPLFSRRGAGRWTRPRNSTCMFGICTVSEHSAQQLEAFICNTHGPTWATWKNRAVVHRNVAGSVERMLVDMYAVGVNPLSNENWMALQWVRLRDATAGPRVPSIGQWTKSLWIQVDHSPNLPVKLL